MAKQDMCPICTQPFQEKEIVVEIRFWGEPAKLGHLDCAMSVSRNERRKHPAAA